MIGASAGGIETLRALVVQLPADLPAAVFVVLHMAEGGTSVLPALLNRATAGAGGAGGAGGPGGAVAKGVGGGAGGGLPAVHAVHGQAIEHGRIYVAPPGHHLIVGHGHVRLGRGPRENRCRPAVDPLFRTAAREYGTRVIGVVLSGNLDDGTAGLRAIKSRGGVAVVQDPADALFTGMPASAVANARVDHVVPVARMGELLSRLSREPAPTDAGGNGAAIGRANGRAGGDGGGGGGGAEGTGQGVEIEADVAELDMKTDTTESIGVPAGFACPECGGTLYELKDGHFERFRCRVGHAYSPDTLVVEQAEAIEAALYSALRSIEESAALTRRLAERARARRADSLAVSRFERRAAEAEGHAAAIRRVLRRARELLNGGTDEGAPGAGRGARGGAAARASENGPAA